MLPAARLFKKMGYRAIHMLDYGEPENGYKYNKNEERYSHIAPVVALKGDDIIILNTETVRNRKITWDGIMMQKIAEKKYEYFLPYCTKMYISYPSAALIDIDNIPDCMGVLLFDVEKNIFTMARLAPERMLEDPIGAYQKIVFAMARRYY